MITFKVFLKRHRHLLVLFGLILALTALPVVETILVLGNDWQGVPPTFTDETFYYAHMTTIGDGQLNDGNPYFLEHAGDPPLVLFGGAWLNAIPLWMGVPLVPALILNFIFWSLVFAGLFYLFYREFAVPPWFAVAGTLLVYLQCYAHVFRPANLQPVYPIIILFYLALARLCKEQSRFNIFLVAAATAASFYLFSYFWQTVVITLGLLFLYTLVCKRWQLMRATLWASGLGGIVGLPAVLYTLWLSHTSIYFWESIARFGLVHTHIPMAEVVYSGGWVGLVLLFLAVLYWRSQPLRRDDHFLHLVLFVAISGLGLWIMQGSNLLTGILLETGEHLRGLILPWLAFVDVLLIAYLWRQRMLLTKGLQWFALGAVMLFSVASLYYTYYYFLPFAKVDQQRDFWRTEQSYAGPFEWLQSHEQLPVVVWSNPHNYLAPNLPIFTRHYDLFTTFGMWHLVSQQEVNERYLVSQYFDNSSVDMLKKDIETYLGRQDTAHIAKSLERGIKVCKLLHFLDKNKYCGTVQTPVEVLGDPFFAALEKQFQSDIKPNIKAYLKKYHVSYILKDKTLDPQYHPERLGGTVVYEDARYELYHLPQ